jgi:predicted transposase/invertase (TIGR01784 family)
MNKQRIHLDPKLDIVFKALFGKPDNGDMLISLLNGMLELPAELSITGVQILSPLSDLDVSDDKLIVLDLLVSDARGHRYGIEMQCRNHKAFPERMLYYAARRYSEQLKSSKPYTTLKPLVLLVFTDFLLFPARENFRERFELRGRDHGELFSEHLSVLLVELPKFRKTTEQGLSLGEKWALFLKEGTNMQSRIEDAAWLTPALRKAIEELERMEGEETMRELYEARMRQLQVMATELEDSYEQGIEKGLEKGIEQGIEKGIEKGIEQGAWQAAHDLALRLLEEDESIERVARLTGLPKEELIGLRSSKTP